MEPSRGEESGKLYLPNDQGEYVPEVGMHNFSVQGLSDALMALESKVTVVQLPTEDYALILEVTMTDCPRCPHPPAFSWNVGMVMHILKGDPILRDLEHVQVDGPGVAYLFFNKQGHRGLKHDAAQALRTHVAEVFSEWISHSGHFAITPLPPAEGWHQAVATSERHWQRSRAEHPDHPTHNPISSESDSTPQLVGSAPTSMAHLGQTEETGGGHTPRVPISWPRRRPPKGCAVKNDARNSPSSSPDRGGANSDGYSMASEVHSTRCCRRSAVRSDSHQHAWICRFSNQLTQMRM